MSKATKSELLLRSLNKFLTVEEYNDPVKSERIRAAFWAGATAARKLYDKKKKKAPPPKERPGHDCTEISLDEPVSAKGGL